MVTQLQVFGKIMALLLPWRFRWMQRIQKS